MRKCCHSRKAMSIDSEKLKVLIINPIRTIFIRHGRRRTIETRADPARADSEDFCFSRAASKCAEARWSSGGRAGWLM